MVPDTRVHLAADGEDLVILACTVFDWSTRVTDRRTDRWTELWWLRHHTEVAAVARKNSMSQRLHQSIRYDSVIMAINLYSSKLWFYSCLNLQVIKASKRISVHKCK